MDTEGWGHASTSEGIEWVPMPYADLPGVRLAYDLHGADKKGTPLVLMHGIMVDRSVWMQIRLLYPLSTPRWVLLAGYREARKNPKHMVAPIMGDCMRHYPDSRDIRCPTLVMCGSRDRIVGPRVEVVEGAGHRILRERAVEVSTLLEAFYSG